MDFWNDPGIRSIYQSRRIAWNATLVIGGIFGIAAAAAPNFVVFCTMIALIGTGIFRMIFWPSVLFFLSLSRSSIYLLREVGT